MSRINEHCPLRGGSASRAGSIDVALERNPRADLENITSAANRASVEIMKSLTPEMRIAVMNAADNELSTTATHQLEYVLFNNSFQVLDRSQLAHIRSEQEFQFSGEVDDDTAVRIGKFIGADVVISVLVSESDRILRVRALSVQTARVIGSGLERY